MATIQNYKDIELQATSPRAVKQGSDYINLTSPYQYFKVSDTVSPSSITITANLVGTLKGTVTFSVESGTATITQSNNTCTVQYSNMSTETITILATLVYLGLTYESRYTISKVNDGADGADGASAVIIDLLSEADVVATASDGTGYTLPTGNSLKLYIGSTVVTSGVTYSGTATKNGLTATIASTGAITLSGSSWTSTTESFTFTATYSGVNYSTIYTISKSKAGTDAVIVDLVSEADVVATASDGTGYTLPTGNSLKLYKGGVVVTSGVTYSGTATKNGLTATIDSTGAITLSGSSWTSTTESFVLTATYNSIAYAATYTVAKAKAGTNGTNGANGAKGDTGNRGSVRLSGTVASAAWSDATANAVFTNAGYSYKVIGDICTLSYSTTWTLTKFWDGSIWSTISELVDGNLLVTGTIAGNKLAANTVTADKIDSRGLSIKDASGNIILAAGTALTTSYISGLGTLATQNSISYGSITGVKPPSDADKTSLNTAAGIANQGIFATAPKLTDLNVSTYISSAAIGSAYIKDLSASKISAGTMSTASIEVTASGNWVFQAYAGTAESVRAWNPYFYRARAGNFSNLSQPAFIATSELETTPAILATSQNTSTGATGYAVKGVGDYLSTTGIYAGDSNGGPPQLRYRFGSNLASYYSLVLQADRNLVLYDYYTALWASGTSTSDRNLKTNIVPTAKSGLGVINQIEIVDFSWKEDSVFNDGGLTHTNVIAQDVELIVPAAVKTAKGTKLVIKDEFIPYLIKAVQELSAEVAELKARL